MCVNFTEGGNYVDFHTMITHNPVITYITSGALGGLLGGLILLLIQTTLKQGVAYQYKKKIEEMKHDHNKNLRDISHEYEKYLKDFNHQYEEKLVLFNEQIAIQAEHRKLDFDRKIHDFSIYSTKRYEVYSELFKQVYRLGVKLIQRREFQRIPNYIKSKEDVLELLEKREVIVNKSTLLEIESLFALYQEGEGVKDIKVPENILDWIAYYIQIDMIEGLCLEIRDTIDFYEENTLYLSEIVYLKTKEIIRSLTKFADVEIIVDNAVIDDLDKSVNELRTILKKELSVGDYSYQSSNK